jgi:Na+-driven multidrug efflux pump
MAKVNNANELGIDKIGKLLLKYSIPAIIATAAASFYNIIDRIFIGQGVGPMAISGLAITFPLMNITAAFGSMIGVGASSMVSIRLGQHDRKGATLILGNAVMLNIILGVCVGVGTLIFLEPVLYALGASRETVPYAKEFMQVILAGNVFTHLYLGLNNIMRASGYPRKAMVTTLVTVGVNLILAPVFIFHFRLGHPWSSPGYCNSPGCGNSVCSSSLYKNRQLCTLPPRLHEIEKGDHKGDSFNRDVKFPHSYIRQCNHYDLEP